jgi:hypothetical protein
LIAEAGYTPVERDTLYNIVRVAQVQPTFGAPLPAAKVPVGIS